MLKVTKRKGTPYYQITGTCGGQRIRETTGTTEKADAERLRVKRENEILNRAIGGRSFADAVEAYVENGGEQRYLSVILEHMADMALDKIGQDEIDRIARTAYGHFKKTPQGKTYKHKPSTIKRQFYDPVAAVLHYAADLGWIPYRRVKKPKVTLPAPEWAEVEWFQNLWAVCGKDLKALTMFLCLTGCRIQECLDLEWKEVDLKAHSAFIRKTKTKAYRTVRLPPELMASLRAIKSQGGTRVFGAYNDQDAFRRALRKACAEAGIPYMSSHKIGSHTFATWLRRYAGMDARGLRDTGRWASVQMAERYTHTDVSAESMKADILGKLFK